MPTSLRAFLWGVLAGSPTPLLLGHFRAIFFQWDLHDLNIVNFYECNYIFRKILFRREMSVLFVSFTLQQQLTEGVRTEDF